MALHIYQPDELHLFGFDAGGCPYGDARREISEDVQACHDMVREKQAIAEIAGGKFLGVPLRRPCRIVWPAQPPEAKPAFENLRGVVAFIHAKGSSERVQWKAMRCLGGMPLFVRAIEKCKQVPAIAAVVIDSDSAEIRDIGVEHGALPLVRPPSLATNATAGDGLETWAAYHAPNTEAIAVVIPTSPFLAPATIAEAIARLLKEPEADSIAAVRSDKLFLWDKGRPAYGKARTGQSLPGTVWETTGLYVTRTPFIRAHHQRINYDRCLPLAVSPLEGLDINTEEDWQLAELVSKGLGESTS
jgi:CMP-N-acetylneuraminic acid synthetase